MTKNVNVYDLQGKAASKLSLPEVFEVPVRTDVIRRAVVALQTHRLQPQGRDPMAGKHTSAQSMGVGHDLARMPRVKGERHQRSQQAAFAPGTVKGRLAHPPTPFKNFYKRFNRKELRLALKSAISATALKEVVAKRGHRVDGVPALPLIVTDEIQKIKKVSDAKSVLQSLGLWPDVERAANGRHIRAGKGRGRGRRFRQPIGPLVVVAKDEGVRKAFGNLSGVSVVEARNLNVLQLAPGTHPGRLTVWSESAVKHLQERLAS